ncbi:MAG: hypothetical protein JWN85_3642, partial [Gammaproteobacteria bacterium]|nr:hypothetical protein [Gammaproteobacteria bacterium]
RSRVWSSLESKKNNRVGAWRSLVAHLHGVQGVPSSNLGAPTNENRHLRSLDKAAKMAVYTSVYTFAELDAVGNFR